MHRFSVSCPFGSPPTSSSFAAHSPSSSILSAFRRTEVAAKGRETRDEDWLRTAYNLHPLETAHTGLANEIPPFS